MPTLGLCSSHRCGISWVSVSQLFSPVAVICERVVAGESQEDPKPGPQREEYLSSGVHPHLQKEDEPGRHTWSYLFLQTLILQWNWTALRNGFFFSQRLELISISHLKKKNFFHFLLCDQIPRSFLIGLWGGRRDSELPHSCRQGDLKRSRHSALKRGAQRWILVSESERGAFVNGQKI